MKYMDNIVETLPIPPTCHHPHFLPHAIGRMFARENDVDDYVEDEEADEG